MSATGTDFGDCERDGQSKMYCDNVSLRTEISMFENTNFGRFTSHN
jgi:hypothetical protein